MIRYMKKISNNVFCNYKAYEGNWSIYIRKAPFPTLITIFWIKKQQITLKLLETKELVPDSSDSPLTSLINYFCPFEEIEPGFAQVLPVNFYCYFPSRWLVKGK